jgi:hypothetical protein
LPPSSVEARIEWDEAVMTTCNHYTEVLITAYIKSLEEPEIERLADMFHASGDYRKAADAMLELLERRSLSPWNQFAQRPA